jgi:menaquinol-cytochrome c reductase iron-sulfur subunit
MEKNAMSTTEEKQVPRRDFMRAAIVAIGGVIGAAIGLPAIPYVMGPALQADKEEWIRLGTTNKVELDAPTLFKTSIQTQTGWIEAEQEFSVYVSTENGQDFVAMSNICTHLGCRVRWIAEDQGFFCPCHNGVFARDGSVQAGPPPRPLDRFDTKVEDSILYVKRG